MKENQVDNTISPYRKSQAESYVNIQSIVIRTLYNDTQATNFLGAAVALIFALITSRTVSFATQAYICLSVILTAYLLRILLILIFKKCHASAGINPKKKWLTYFRVTTFLVGCGWSTMSLFFFDSSYVFNQTLIAIIFSGLASTAVMSYGLDLVSLFGFIMPVVLVFSIKLIMENTLFALPISMIILLFVVILFIVARRKYDLLYQNFSLAENAGRGQAREKAYASTMEILARGAPLNTVLNHIVNNHETLNPGVCSSILLLGEQDKALHHAATSRLPDFYSHAVDGLPIGENIGACGAVAFEGERVIIEDIQTHPNWTPEFRLLAARANLASCWSEPIKNKQGKVLGTFAAYHAVPKKPTEEDIEAMQRIAQLAAFSIEQASLNKELHLTSMLYQNSSESIMIVDANNLIIAVNPAFSVDNGYSAEESIGMNPNILRSDRHPDWFYQDIYDNLNASGQWQGEIWNRKKNGDIYPVWLRINNVYSPEGELLNRVGVSTDITNKKLAEDTIWKQANFDTLTELPNRNRFHDQFLDKIKKTQQANLQLALMFIDLDRFKEVNDTLGHHYGDMLLKETAKRLLACANEKNLISEFDVLARLGGDEFTFILSEISQLDCLESIAQKILHTLSMPFYLDNQTIYISASIGITIYPTDSDNPGTLIKNADQAMYAAKRMGRNQYCYFNESMQTDIRNRVGLTNDLRKAIEGNELFLVFQPIVDFNNGKIQKAEALIRWEHPEKGLIMPNEFIAIAEETGLIISIGDWVFQQAADTVAIWRQTLDADFQVSINKSPVQFHNPRTNQQYSHLDWADYLKSLGLPGQCLTVEITESLLLENKHEVQQQLLEFRDLGIQVSLDDFGTGYSSLSYLQRFDIDYLKIDRSFVQNLHENQDDIALCEAIIVMAHKLNIRVVAEGVETEQQYQLLKAAGCDFGQGFYFSKGITQADFETLVLEWNQPDLAVALPTKAI